MSRDLFNSPVARVVNGAAVSLINAPVIGRLIGRGLVVIRYVGRRSGKTFEIPVGYRRSGGNLIIGVTHPTRRIGGEISSATADRSPF